MSILNLNILSSVQERDIDLLLVEELRANEEFADWFVARTWGLSRFKSTVGAWHSVTRGDQGESDIVFVFFSVDNQRHALLVENKIDAMAQPEQAARYRLRGDHGKAVGDWTKYRTCVVAPQRYLASEKHPGGYDDEISYEEVMAFYSSRRSRDARFSHKAHVVSEAIEQNRRRPLRLVSLPVTSYFKAYYAFARTVFPSLGAVEPGERAAGNTWMYFRPAMYPTDVQLVHQTTSGHVKLFFDGHADRFNEIEARMLGAIEPDMRLEPAGKSVSLSLTVPQLSLAMPNFDGDKANIQKALESLTRLHLAFRKAYPGEASAVRDVDGSTTSS